MIVTLTNGDQVDSSGLTFNPGSYHVFWGTFDVTKIMRQNDKVQVFPGFSRELDNVRASDEHTIEQGGTPATVGSTSTWDIFWHQIATDPLGAPLDAASNQVKKVWDNPLGKTVIVIAGIALGLYALNTLAKFKDVVK